MSGASEVSFARGGMGDMMYPLAASGGVVAPSARTAVFQNPAGISFVDGLNLNGQTGFNSSFGTPIYRGGLMYGNGMMGLTGGVSLAPTANITSAYFGGGFGIASIKTRVGVSGSVGISPSGSSQVNAGLMFGPFDKLNFGFTAFGLDSSITELGGGMSLDFGPGAKIVVDATSDRSFGSFNFKPSLLLFTPQLGVTFGYGFGNGGSTQIIDGFNAGVFVMLAKKVNLEVYYNELAPFYASVAFKI